MDEHTISIRLSKETYDALLARQRESEVDVSISAIVRSLLAESLGVRRASKKNGRAKR